MSCQNSDDTGTFRNSNIPSFEIQTEDMDNPSYGALFMVAISNPANYTFFFLHAKLKALIKLSVMCW